MRTGHVYLEQDTKDKGFLRVADSEEVPETESLVAGRRVLWAARFLDRDAAVMHAHNRLCRNLIDIDQRLYDAPVAQAIAALETDILPHKRVFIDKSLDAETLQNLDLWTAYYRKRQQRLETVVSWIRIAAIGLLVMNLVLGLSG